MLNLLELIDPQSWDTDRVVAWVTGQAHAGKKPAAEYASEGLPTPRHMSWSKRRQ